MKNSNPKLGSRLVIGAVAGVIGTVAIAAAMRRLQGWPASETTAATAAAPAAPSEETAKDASTAAQLAYGAASGALMGVANVMMGPVSGGLAGMGVWLAGHMGWVPGLGFKPATGRRPRRNLLAMGAHIVWGVATARAMRELAEGREAVVKEGTDENALPPGTRD